MHLIRAATLTVASLDAAKAYCDWLDYEIVENGNIGSALADSWHAPKNAGAPYCVLRPASEEAVYIRMIEQAPHPEYSPLRSYGWAAIEICTQDTERVNARMERGPFEIIGPPKVLDGMPAIYPMQVKGADHEIVYLTQIRDDMPEYDLPRAKSLIDRLFILVLACPDIETEGAWLEKHLKLSKGRTIAINYTMINKAFGLPDGTQHKLATLKHGRDVFLEIDEYPNDTIQRPTHNGYLPPCTAIGSFIHPEFSELEAINEGVWVSPPAERDGIINNGNRVGVLRSPGGTIFEMIET